MRGGARQPSLAEEGFELIRRSSRVTDFADREQLDRIYRREAEEIVIEATGAARAFTLDLLIFRSGRHDVRTAKGAAADSPSRLVHGDYTAASTPALADEELARRGLPARAEGRIAIYNLWRSLRPPPQDVSLALCDARSVDQKDLGIALAVEAPGIELREVEFLLYRHNPGHRWCWFSAIEPNEAILFRQYDSGVAQPSGCPHSAFTNPRAPAGTLPRLSIEVRVVAFFE